MGSEFPTMSELAPNPDTSPRGRIDPVRFAVQGVLALYLLPVVLLVAAIGVISIAAGQSARLIAKAVGRLTPGQSRASLQSPQAHGRAIGSRPISGQRTRRTRIIR